MDIRGKRFVITGGSGFIGSHIVDALIREDVGDVIVYDNFASSTAENLAGALEDSRVHVFEAGGDVCHTDLLSCAFEGAHGVFHCAALWLLPCHEFPRAAFRVNVEGTFNVLEACVAQGVERLVVSSAAAVYADTADGQVSEDHPLRSTTLYGSTKIACEEMAHAFYQRYGLRHAILRYMNVYGRRQRYEGPYVAVMMKMLQAIDRGEPIVIYGDGSQSYDFVDVRDCAVANICAMKADTVDAAYNVGTGVKTSICRLAELLLHLSGSDVGIALEPGGSSSAQSRIGDPTKALRDLGFVAAMPLEQGLPHLLEWRENHRQMTNQRASLTAD